MLIVPTAGMCRLFPGPRTYLRAGLGWVGLDRAGLDEARPGQAGVGLGWNVLRTLFVRHIIDGHAAVFGQIFAFTTPLALVWFITYLLTGEE